MALCCPADVLLHVIVAILADFWTNRVIETEQQSTSVHAILPYSSSTTIEHVPCRLTNRPLGHTPVQQFNHNRTCPRLTNRPLVHFYDYQFYDPVFR